MFREISQHINQVVGSFRELELVSLANLAIYECKYRFTAQPVQFVEPQSGKI